MSPELYVPLITICAVFFVSEVISKLLKSKLDSLLIAMILLVICGSVLGWVTEKDFDTSLFSTITYGFGLPFAIISFGGNISIEEFKGQLKTLVIGICSIAAIIGVGLLIGTPLFGFRLSLYSSVEVAGGGQAGLIFLNKANEVGDKNMIALMLLLMNLQICVGYPMCTFMLRKGVKKHLLDGDMMSICAANEENLSKSSGVSKSKKIKLPDFISGSFYYVFMMLGLVALASFYIGEWTTVSHYVWEIVLGFLVVQVGLLERNSMHKVGAGGLIFGMMYATVCASMCSITWKELASLLPKVAVYFIVGLIGCALVGAVLCRMMHKNFFETYAVALGCMVGFPPSLKVAEAAVSALKVSEGLSDEDTQKIIGYYQPQIVISGVVTISVFTGIIAGIIVGYI